jgi:hypothetical protein
MDFIDVQENTRFLGSEFLMWLWHRVDTEGDGFEVMNGAQITIWFDDDMAFYQPLGDQQNRVKGGVVADSAEALAAVRSGKMIERAKMRLIAEDREWSFMFQGPEFLFTGVKLPDCLADDYEEHLIERIELMKELEAFWLAVFGEFMVCRLNSIEWLAKALEIVKWIKTREE